MRITNPRRNHKRNLNTNRANRMPKNTGKSLKIDGGLKLNLLMPITGEGLIMACQRKS